MIFRAFNLRDAESRGTRLGQDKAHVYLADSLLSSFSDNLGVNFVSP